MQVHVLYSVHTLCKVGIRTPVNIQSTVHSIPRQSMPIAIMRRYTVWVRNSGNQGGEKGDTWLSRGTVQKMNLRRLTLNSSSNNNVGGSTQIKDTNCNQKLLPIISRRHQTWKGTKIIYTYITYIYYIIYWDGNAVFGYKNIQCMRMCFAVWVSG